MSQTTTNVHLASHASEPTRPSDPAKTTAGRSSFTRRLAAAFSSLLLVLALAAVAQDEEGSTPPAQVRGTSNDSAVGFGEIDSVNLFNGNLTLSVPIGASYPAGGSLSYGMQLIYNASAWDFAETCTEDPSGPGPSRTIYDALPSRLSNAGMGWSLHFGRLLLPTHDIANPGLKVAYVAPDGSRHAFYDELRPGVAPGGKYTRDSSYIRWTESPAGCFGVDGNQASAGCAVVLEFSDGSQHTMKDAFPSDPINHDFRTVRIEDRFGNAVNIAYNGSGNPARSSQWTLTDSFESPPGSGMAVRTHHVNFVSGREDRPLVAVGAPNAGNHIDGDDLPLIENIDLQGFGGERAVYSLIVEREALPRHNRIFECTEPNDPMGDPLVSPEVAVDLLTGIDLPVDPPSEPDRFSFGYYIQDGFSDGMKSGSVRSVTLPTGGGFAWTYDLWNIRTGPLGGNPSELAYGVVGKYAFVAANDLPPLDAQGDQTIAALDLAADGVWRYTQARGTDENGQAVISPWDAQSSDPKARARPCFYVTTVENPAGLVVKSYHVGAKEGFHRANALPFTPCGPKKGVLLDVDDDGVSDVDINAVPLNTVELGPRPAFYLSREIFDQADLTSPLRREYVAYGFDDFPPGPPPFGESSPKTRDYNSRQAFVRTVYLDDVQGAGDPVPGAAHERSTARSDFDGLGHFRLAKLRSTFPGDGDQDRFTNYNPVGCTSFPMSCTPDQSAVPLVTAPWVLNTSRWTEIVQQPEKPTRTERRVVLTEYDLATGFLLGRRILANAAGPGANDFLTCFTAGQSGHVTLERFFGGDHQTLPSSATCASIALTPAYAATHSYAFGSLATSHHLAPDGSRFLRAASNTVDPSTGVVTLTRDTADVATHFEYDARGRLSASWQDDGATTRVDYDLGNASGNVVATRTCALSGGDCSENAALALSKEIYDGLGRLIQEKRRLPSEEVQRSLAFDILGRPTKTGLWTSASGGMTTAGTEFLDYDVFGRAATVRQPDGSTVDAVYFGDRSLSSTVQIETAAGLVASTRTELRDGLGRLTILEEPGLDTTYAYDPQGSLAWVCVNDFNDNARNCGGEGQQRAFEHDGRGLLIAERHPELDPFDPSLIVSQQRTARFTFDARGNVTSKSTASSAFDLGYRFDPAGRVTQVAEGAGGRLLKEFFYARQDDQATPPDRRAGRLVQTKRHHWQGPVDDTVVTETFDYHPISGLATAYSVRSSRGPSFTSEVLGYDPLFNITQLAYPACDRAPCEGIGGSRSVDFTYAQGLLTGITGFASGVTYHQNGDVDRLAHADGTVDERDLDADGWRLTAMRVQGSAGGPTLWTTGSYAYDPAGNIKAIGQDAFTYDLLGRLRTASLVFEGASAGENLTYDTFGNITSISHTGVAPPAPSSFVVNATTNRLAGAGFAYDASGNATGMRLGTTDFTATYDPFKRQRTFAGGTIDRSYLYTVAGERFATLDHALDDETYTPRSATNQVLRRFRKAGGTWSLAKEYVRAGSRAIATIDGNGLVNHLHPDHLGSTRLITRAGAAGVEIVEENKYLPFGMPLHVAAVGDEELQFTGHERDAHGSDVSNDLDYMHARYYTPFWGRFLSVDPVRGASDFISKRNLYSYVSDNPVGRLDPDGRQDTQGSQAAELIDMMIAETKARELKRVEAGRDFANSRVSPFTAALFETFTGVPIDEAYFPLNQSANALNVIVGAVNIGSNASFIWSPGLGAALTSSERTAVLRTLTGTTMKNPTVGVIQTADRIGFRVTLRGTCGGVPCGTMRKANDVMLVLNASTTPQLAAQVSASRAAQNLVTTLLAGQANGSVQRPESLVALLQNLAMAREEEEE